MSKPDGGPAFPRNYDTSIDQQGMTLRQWYAGQALAGMMLNTEVDPDRTESKDVFEVLAKDAFAAADAMIAECEK